MYTHVIVFQTREAYSTEGGSWRKRRDRVCSLGRCAIVFAKGKQCHAHAADTRTVSILMGTMPNGPTMGIKA